MLVEELREALGQFNPKAALSVAIPKMGQPHEAREVHVVGHIDFPGEVKTDHTVYMAEIICDHWDVPGASPMQPIATVQGLIDELEPFPDEMGIRVAVPVATSTHSHRMLDIVMVGHQVGAGGGIQLITESWDNLMQVIKEHPSVVEARLAEHARQSAEALKAEQEG